MILKLAMQKEAFFTGGIIGAVRASNLSAKDKEKIKKRHGVHSLKSRNFGRGALGEIGGALAGQVVGGAVGSLGGPMGKLVGGGVGALVGSIGGAWRMTDKYSRKGVRE